MFALSDDAVPEVLVAETDDIGDMLNWFTSFPMVTL
jgi:hypothetical protein